MIKIPYEDLLDKIVNNTSFTKDQIEMKVRDKLSQLAGLISKEGALHIIANELGVKVFDAVSGKLEIKSILGGMRDIEVLGRVNAVYDIREFNTGARSGKVGSFILSDNTGSIRVVLWNDQADVLKTLSKNMPVKIVDAYAKDNQGRIELHLNDNSKIEPNPSEPVPELQSISKKISELSAQDNDVDVAGRVSAIYEIREFNTAKGSGKVGSFLLDDGENKIRVTLWNDKTDILPSLSENMVVNIKSAYVKDNQGRLELHVGNNGEVVLNATANIPEIHTGTIRKKISELTDSDSDVEILGTVVNVFEPRFFEVCPRCRRRVKQKDEGFYCDTHGIVEPNYSYVLTLFLDDGSENIRTVFFNAQTKSLLNKTEEEISAIRKDPTQFEQVKENILGKIIKISGRVNRNIMFDRLEFVAQKVDVNVNPDEEVKRLEEKVQTEEKVQAEEKLQTEEKVQEKPNTSEPEFSSADVFKEEGEEEKIIDEQGTEVPIPHELKDPSHQ